jgi:NitT/TauT family transport system permease protein
MRAYSSAEITRPLDGDESRAAGISPLANPMTDKNVCPTTAWSLTGLTRMGRVKQPTRWFAVCKPLTPRQSAGLKLLAFILPLAVWSLVSYCPYVWHPQVRVTDPGNSSFLAADMLIDKAPFAEENGRLVAEAKKPAIGSPANPIFIPAPHEVGRAMYTAFTTPPLRNGDMWLHQSLWHSIQIIFWGFAISCIIGVPLGVICGTYGLFSHMTEPFVDFIRYMPAPAFGALMVAIFGIDDAPKIAIIFIGTFFQLVLVVANTTRKVDVSLLEAAQTLGVRGRKLISKVVVPSILPHLYNDLRIMLGFAWTYLIVAELIGASSGISYFINQQGKYRHYENVYAGIIMIGVIGLATDQFLAFVAPRLFPWTAEGARVKRWNILLKIQRLVNAIGAKPTPRKLSKHAVPAPMPAEKAVPTTQEPDVRTA